MKNSPLAIGAIALAALFAAFTASAEPAKSTGDPLSLRADGSTSNRPTRKPETAK